MTMWPVSPKLNSVKNDTPDLMEPIKEEAPPDLAGEVPRVNEAASDEPANSDSDGVQFDNFPSANIRLLGSCPNVSRLTARDFAPRPFGRPYLMISSISLILLFFRAMRCDECGTGKRLALCEKSCFFNQKS
jgi:hypothetical protein